MKMHRCIKVVLNKCFEIEDSRIKDKNKPYLQLDITKVKEIIEEASLKACHACNKSSDMWKEYYFNNRREAENEFNNIHKDVLDTEIIKIFNEKIGKVKDKSKLQSEKYIEKIKKDAEQTAKNKLLMNIEKKVEQRGRAYKNVVQDTTKLIMKDYNTGNVGSLDQQLVQGNWKRDKEAILKYEANIPQYKKDTPFIFKDNNYILSKNSNNYFVDLSFFSIPGYDKHNLKSGTRLKFQIDKLNKSEYAILDRIMCREYSQGTSQIAISDKGKIELTISYNLETKAKLLDPNRILGIDLGIVNTATLSIWDDTYEAYDYLKWNQRVIEGKEIIHFRQQIYERRKSMLRANKLSNLTHGHGKKTRCKNADILQNKVDNFKETYNHKLSRYIVNFAVKNNCGTIQMENLKGFSSKKTDKFLKEWSYYDLQNKITYKAEEHGIKVAKVNPKYTSKRCSDCGVIHDDNRNCKVNQSKFTCVVCGHRENADINASKNIALKNIDEIIEEQLEAQDNNTKFDVVKKCS